MSIEITSFGRFFFFISVPFSVWCWLGITHYVTRLEASLLSYVDGNKESIFLTLVKLVANTVQKLRWPAKCLGINLIDHLLDLLKRKVRAQPLQVNLRKLTRVIYLHMCAAIPQQYIHRHMLSMSVQCLVIDATPCGCTKYWIEIIYDVIWFCRFVLRVSINPLI